MVEPPLLLLFIAFLKAWESSFAEFPPSLGAPDKDWIEFVISFPAPYTNAPFELATLLANPVTALAIPE